MNQKSEHTGGYTMDLSRGRKKRNYTKIDKDASEAAKNLGKTVTSTVSRKYKGAKVNPVIWNQLQMIKSKLFLEGQTVEISELVEEAILDLCTKYGIDVDL